MLDYATGHTASAVRADSTVLRAEEAERMALLLVVGDRVAPFSGGWQCDSI